MKRGKYVIMSIGGSIIIPPSGFDIDFLKKFRELIVSRIGVGDKFILVVGGGAVCRNYQEAGKAISDMSPENLDWLGIAATKFNAEFVRQIFQPYAYGKVISDPTKKVVTNKPILVCSGWKPGCSTDRDAVLLAKTYGVQELYNLSNVDFVYTRDPRLYKDAQKIESIGWKQFRSEIVGDKWQAGAHTPFDPTASREAERLKLTVRFLRGTDLRAVENALKKISFVGTEIHP